MIWPAAIAAGQLACWHKAPSEGQVRVVYGFVCGVVQVSVFDLELVHQRCLYDRRWGHDICTSYVTS